MPTREHVQRTLRRISYEARLGLWHLGTHFRNSVTITTKQGVFTLPIGGSDPISKSLYTRREYELDLATQATALMRKLDGGRQGKGTLLDVGANNGVISIGMLVRGEFERAVAIEPEPLNFSRLERNVEKNRLAGVMTCLNLAATDRNLTLQFELSEQNSGDHRVRKPLSGKKPNELYDESTRKVIDVEGRTLDSIVADLDSSLRADISAVWIDVQGHEGHVFSGARELFSTGIPAVSEVWPYGIRRSGMRKEEFCAVVTSIWSDFWVRRRGRFVRYPIDIFHTFHDELDHDRDFDSVVFTG